MARDRLGGSLALASVGVIGSAGASPSHLLGRLVFIYLPIA